MTLATDCAWALLRSSGVAAAAVAVAWAVRAALASCPRRAGRVLWGMLLVPYLTPVLLVGYAYSRFSLSLIHYPTWNEAFYLALVWLKLVPVATLALAFAPSPISPEAVHCHRLLRRGNRVSAAETAAFWLRGEGRAAGVAFAVVFLLAFGEFEMASLLTVRTWTVTLFDAQAGGLALGESLRLALPALACEAVLLAAALWLVFAGQPRVNRPSARHARPGRAVKLVAWAYLATAWGGVTLVPAAIVLRGTVRGFRLLSETLRVTRDILPSLLVAGVAAAAAYAGAGWFLGEGRRRVRGRGKLLAAFALCVPGLFGALLLALLVLTVFQLPGVRAASDTPLPLVLALAALLFPFALLLRALVTALRPGEAVHAARLLEASSAPTVVHRGHRLAWELTGRARFWVAFLLFGWGYFDLTASAILAPSTMTPVLVRLYNFMHYGQTSVLSAMVCVAFAAPFLVLVLAALACHVWASYLRLGPTQAMPPLQG